MVLELVVHLPVAGIERRARRGYGERCAAFTARNELEGAPAGITDPVALPGGAWSAGGSLTKVNELNEVTFEHICHTLGS